MKKKIFYYLFTFILCLIVTEISIRLIIPEPFRIMSDKVVLPSNQVYKIKNNINPKLDKVIIHTRNSLGLRGPEISDSTSIKIITVGGSTTNCFYLNDKQEWTSILNNLFLKDNKNVWMNNAGFSGQSTFGHIILTDNYLVKLKPKILIFYIGINDLLRDQMSENDRYFLLSSKGFKKIAYHSRLLMLLENYYTTKVLSYSFINTDEKYINYLQLKDANNDSVISISNEGLNLNAALSGYNNRVVNLINTCKKNDIKPIFLTQASLYTCGYDNKHQINLGKKVNGDMSICQISKLLDKYNLQLIETCKKQNTSCIDMAQLMPKSIDYFSDFVHFTPKGSLIFANILYKQLQI